MLFNFAREILAWEHYSCEKGKFIAHGIQAMKLNNTVNINRFFLRRVIRLKQTINHYDIEG